MAGYEEFSDPRLVKLYDVLNPPGLDTNFFLSLPLTSDQSILDVGCGTGLLAVEMARRDLTSVGADPSSQMLDVARGREGAEPVRWVDSDAAGLDLDTRFDLVTMTSHVFQFFLSDEATLAAMTNIRRHMKPGGRVAFETRNPLAKAWESWNRAGTHRSIDHADLGRVDTWVELDGVRDDLVDFTLRYRFTDGSALASHNTLRFPSKEKVLDLVATAGFPEVTTYGNFDRSDFSTRSPEIIVVATA